MSATFTSIVELFTDEFSKDLPGRRAEAIKRLARLFVDGFLVADLPALQEVLDHAVKKLDQREITLAPGLAALLKSLAKPYKRSRAAEERLPANAEALCAILRSASDTLSIGHAPEVCAAAAETLVTFASAGLDDGTAEVGEGEEDTSTSAFHHRLLRDSGALGAAVLAFTAQFQAWSASVLDTAGGDDAPPAVRTAALSGAKSPDLVLTLGRLLLLSSEMPDNVGVMIAHGCVESMLDAIAYFAQPMRNLHDASLGVVLEVLWNLSEHCFVSLQRGSSSARSAAPSIARLQRKHRDVNALRRVLVDLHPMALSTMHALLGRLVREGHTQHERELRNDLVCVLSVLARASYAPEPFLQSGLASTLILLSSAAENGLDVGCPLSNFASTSGTDKELKQLCWHTLLELCKTVMAVSPGSEGRDGHADAGSAAGGGSAGPSRGSSPASSPARSRVSSVAPKRAQSEAEAEAAAAAAAAASESASSLATSYQSLLTSGPLLPTLLLYVDTRERNHPYTRVWTATQRRDLELLSLRLLGALLPLVSPRLLQLEGPSSLLLYMRVHSGVLAPSFRGQMRQAAVDAGLADPSSGGYDDASDALQAGPVDPDRVNAAGAVLARLCRLAGVAGAAISLPFLHEPALWRLAHTRPRLANVPVQGHGAFGAFLDACGSDADTLAVARGLADKDFTAIDAFVAAASPFVPFSADDPRFGGSGCPRTVAGGVRVPVSASGNLDADLAGSLTSVRQLGDLGGVRDTVALLRATMEASPLLAAAATAPGAGGGAGGGGGATGGYGGGATGGGFGFGGEDGEGGGLDPLAGTGGGEFNDPMGASGGVGSVPAPGAASMGGGGGGGGGDGGGADNHIASLQETLCLLLAGLTVEDSGAVAHSRGRAMLERGLAPLAPVLASPDLAVHIAGAAPNEGIGALLLPYRQNRLRAVACGAVPTLLALLRRAVGAARSGNIAEASGDETRPRVALAAVCALRACVAGIPDAEAQAVIGSGVDTLLDLAEAAPRALLAPTLACLAECCGGRDAAACARAWRGEATSAGAREFLLRLWLAEEARLGIRRDPGTGGVLVTAGASPLRVLDAGGPPDPSGLKTPPGTSGGAPSASASTASLLAGGGGSRPLLTGGGGAGVGGAPSHGIGAQASTSDVSLSSWDVRHEGEEEPAAFKSLRRALRAARMYGSGKGSAAGGAADGGGGGGADPAGGASVAAHVAASDLRPVLYAALLSLGLLQEEEEKGPASGPTSPVGKGSGARGAAGVARQPLQLREAAPGQPSSAADVASAAALDTVRALPALLVGTAWDDVAGRLASLGTGPVEEDARVLQAMQQRLGEVVAHVHAAGGQHAEAYLSGVSASSTRLAATLAAGAGSASSAAARARLGLTAAMETRNQRLPNQMGRTGRPPAAAAGPGAELQAHGSAASAGSAASGVTSASAAAGGGIHAHQTMEERKAGQAHRAAMLERSFMGHKLVGADLRSLLEESGSISGSGVAGGSSGSGSPGGGH